MKSLLISLILLINGCQTSAESNYELNRRSGLSLSQDLGAQSYEQGKSLNNNELVVNSNLKSSPRLTAPAVKKVWAPSGQINENTWLQGTWIYIQTEKPRWVLPSIKKAKK